MKTVRYHPIRKYAKGKITYKSVNKMAYIFPISHPIVIAVMKNLLIQIPIDHIHGVTVELLTLCFLGLLFFICKLEASTK